MDQLKIGGAHAVDLYFTHGTAHLGRRILAFIDVDKVKAKPCKNADPRNQVAVVKRCLVPPRETSSNIAIAHHQLLLSSQSFHSPSTKRSFYLIFNGFEWFYCSIF
jgi:hypothetical protein